MTLPVSTSSPLLAELRQLIDADRQQVATAVNAELTQLYLHIGRRIMKPAQTQLLPRNLPRRALERALVA